MVREPSQDEAARSLSDVHARHVQVAGRLLPWWTYPVMGALVAALFVVEDVGDDTVRRVVESAFWLSYLGFLVEPMVRRRREQKVKPRRDLFPDIHHRGRLMFAGAFTAAILVGVVLGNQGGPPHLMSIYGVALGAAVAAGGLWLRRARLRNLRSGLGR